MPRPGSHRFAIRKARLRKALGNSGIPDRQADELAKDIVEGEKGWLPRSGKAVGYLENWRRHRARKAGASGS